MALKPDAKPQSVTLPPLAEDAVAYIAQNPVKQDEIATATFKRSVFVSSDQGKTWKRIAQAGAAHDGTQEHFFDKGRRSCWLSSGLLR